MRDPAKGPPSDAESGSEMKRHARLLLDAALLRASIPAFAELKAPGGVRLMTSRDMDNDQIGSVHAGQTRIAEAIGLTALHSAKDRAVDRAGFERSVHSIPALQSPLAPALSAAAQ